MCRDADFSDEGGGGGNHRCNKINQRTKWIAVSIVEVFLTRGLNSAVVNERDAGQCAAAEGKRGCSGGGRRGVTREETHLRVEHRVHHVGRGVALTQIDAGEMKG